jgi:hypothetical protein
MTAATLAQPTYDLRARIRPSREQVRVAAAIFSAATEDVTAGVVPVVVADSDHQEPTAQWPLEYPGGYWLADRGRRDGTYGYTIAREAAEAAAQTHLRINDRRGIPGWVNIRPDGTGAGFDGLQ